MLGSWISWSGSCGSTAINTLACLSVYLQLISLAEKARQFTDQLVELVLGSGLERCLVLVYKIEIEGTFCVMDIQYQDNNNYNYCKQQLISCTFLLKISFKNRGCSLPARTSVHVIMTKQNPWIIETNTFPLLT